MKAKKEKPILFSGEMVRAILDGRKTQTRRVVTRLSNWSYFLTWNSDNKVKIIHDVDDFLKFMSEYDRLNEVLKYCPYGQVGDQLWVRETWNTWGIYDHVKPSDLSENIGIAYTANMNDPKEEACGKIRPSIFMCRWMSRIQLAIKSVRIERVREISNNRMDCLAEGVIPSSRDSVLTDFVELWDKINSKRGFGWDANPWVWVVEFERLEA